jgi:hypothetical protein
MTRWIAAAAMLATLGALLIWQWSRERQIAACHQAGGIWNGAQSRCQPAPGRPLLRRDLERG